MKLGKDFFARKADVVARELLGKVLVVGEKKARIVETEAYFDEKDPASRACKGGDLRKTMEKEAGTILVYGVHNNWLINFVTGKEGRASAVLIRAVEPVNFDARTNGPGLLTKALDIGKEFHGAMLGKHVKIIDNKENLNIVSSKRIGVSEDMDIPLRYYIKDNGFVSRK